MKNKYVSRQLHRNPSGWYQNCNWTNAICHDFVKSWFTAYPPETITIEISICKQKGFRKMTVIRLLDPLFEVKVGTKVYNLLIEEYYFLQNHFKELQIGDSLYVRVTDSLLPDKDIPFEK
jgi:hypothetical protein